MDLPHPMSPQWGGPFYLGWLNPRETSLAIWGFERKRLKGLIIYRKGTFLRDKTTMTLVHAIVVNTSLINDYQYLMYMSINNSKY
jgi:hypothetical protein